MEIFTSLDNFYDETEGQGKRCENQEKRDGN